MMHHIRSHPRLAGLAAALLACLLAVAVLAARSRTAGGCPVAPPIPVLPAQLRALGDFDQPYDATMLRGLGDAALEAASALHPDLAAATSLGAPVEITALDPARHDAIVFPLGTNPGPDGAPRAIAGLAVFLRSCGDQAYFSTVDDLAAAPPPAFPGVSRDRAARLLGPGSQPELVYATTPLQPSWRDRRTGASVPAA
ncbi:MAG: hypothetical protein QOG45_1175 [Chloroflexota bacterium]|nr:hypothetical protein [Chloroflexota bacterium]